MSCLSFACTTDNQKTDKYFLSFVSSLCIIGQEHGSFPLTKANNIISLMTKLNPTRAITSEDQARLP